MTTHKKDTSLEPMIVLGLVFTNVIVCKTAFVYNPNWWLALIVTLPGLFWAVYFWRKKKMMQPIKQRHEGEDI